MDEMVLHDISTLVTLNQEVTRDERTKSDGLRWRKVKTGWRKVTCVEEEEEEEEGWQRMES